MSLKLPPHVRKVKNRLGREYYYFQRYRGTDREEAPIRLPDDPRDPEFWNEYARVSGLPPAFKKTDTVSALITAWQASPEWEAFSDSVKSDWGRYCERIKAAWGDLEVRGIQPHHVLALRDKYKDKRAAANNMLRCLSSMMKWSVPRGWRTNNPCREVELFPSGEGYAPWPWPAIVEAQETLRTDLWWSVGLALYTGQREGDCLAMRWDHITDGLIMVKQEKTSKLVAIPIHRDLQAILDTIPRRAVTILTSSEGTPWTLDGFKTTWAKHKPKMARELGLVFHGLRKSAVVTLLEVGCTDAEVCAITGQSRKMVEHYARMVNQLKLARSAILRWEQNENQTSLVNTLVNTSRSK